MATPRTPRTPRKTGLIQIGRKSVEPMVLRNLPHMPGFNLPMWKEHYRQTQNWGISNGTRIEAQDGCEHDKTKFVKAARPKDTWNQGSWPDSHSREVFKHASLDQSEFMQVPAWDALDRHVLRFNGYFKEAVVEANLENYRVRKVVIYYFLEDDTCQVSEPKEDNSGMPQGTLISRHRFPAAGSGEKYMKLEELKIGAHLSVYGKVFFITSCDGYTRDYFNSIGVDQGRPLSEEIDPFMATREDPHQRQAKQPQTDEKKYREAMLGGGQINPDQEQFIENDRKVLRFHSIMDDCNTATFERRPFTILFFLADDTIEIRELYPLNCGRDSFPIFFRRGKMPRGQVEVLAPQYQERNKDAFVHGHEFYVGQKVNLRGNEFYIYDADDFTRRHFEEKLGMRLDPKVDVQLPERAVPRASTPPYTGYGSWDDSMASVTHLIPKPPKKDLVKLFNNEGKVLRFSAKLVDPRPEDQNRLFVFNYHLFDDTLSIHEPPQRNLGIVTGRFLEKAIHVNLTTGDLFKPEDLTPGKFVTVYKHRFEMLDMADYTRRMIENPETEHRKFNVVVVLEKIRDSLRQKSPLVRDIFRKFDDDHDGVLTLQEFTSALKKYGFSLSEEEVMIVMQHFDRRGDGQVSYNEFCDVLLDEDYTTEMLKTKPRLHTEVDIGYARRAAAKSVDREETGNVRRAVRDLGDKVYQRYGMLPRLFREFEKMTHEHVVSNEQIRQGLLAVGITFKPEDIDRVITYIYPNGEPNRVGYVEFFKLLMASFHDMSAVR